MRNIVRLRIDYDDGCVLEAKGQEAVYILENWCGVEWFAREHGLQPPPPKQDPSERICKI